MSCTNNLKVLANTALESGSHEDLYKYGSAILESNTEDGDAWIYKAAGAALNTDDAEKRAKEAKVLVTKAISLGTSTEVARLAAASIFDAYKVQTQHLDDILLGKVKDYQKVAMPKGGSAVVHGFAQSLNKVLSAKAQAPARAACIELPLLACSLDPSKENFTKALKLVETLEVHAKQNGDYFSEPEYSNLTWRINREILAKAKEIIPDFTPPIVSTTSSNSKSEGCFIATAATGSHDHPKVLFLRNFRDEELAKNNFGKFFINTYYKISPSIAKVISRHPTLKAATVALFINPLISMIKFFKN